MNKQQCKVILMSLIVHFSGQLNKKQEEALTFAIDNLDKVYSNSGLDEALNMGDGTYKP